MNQVVSLTYNAGNDSNKLQAEDRAFHDWYRFVLSFPPHLVREYLERFGITGNQCVLDPFCGTGTVLLECQKLGIPAVGFDAHPMAYFASKVKVDWQADPDLLIEHARTIAAYATKQLSADGIEDNPLFYNAYSPQPLKPLRTLSEEENALLLTNSISSLPLHKTLVFLHYLKQLRHELYYQYELLALAKALVTVIGNLHFGPEVGIGTIKTDAPVISPWLQYVQIMADDLRAVTMPPQAPATIFPGDTRQALEQLEPQSIDAVITSPPYPNEKDYIGEQASYFRLKIPTGKLLADIAVSLGYQLVSIDLFRTRFSSVTKEQLREEVVVLRWPASHIHAIPATGIQQGRLVEMDLFSQDEQNEEEIQAKVTPSAPRINCYQRLMEHIFFSRYKEGSTSIEFAREDLVHAAQELGIKLPKNLGDVLYSFRYRTLLPQSIRDKAPEGMQWIIRPSGRARYCFIATNVLHVAPNTLLAETKIPDATPGIVSMYALGDEQALLSKLRYNRLIDIFTGITCYSLQNHQRTTIVGIGQVETDEIYVGIGHRGAQYVIPLQAKGGNDRIDIVQIEQDVALCAEKFPTLICKPIAAQFIGENRIALFEFEQSSEGIKLYREQHYMLVPPEEMTETDLQIYRQRSLEERGN